MNYKNVLMQIVDIRLINQMVKIIGLCLFFFIGGVSASVSSVPTDNLTNPQLLDQMHNAVISANYDMTFIKTDGNKPSSVYQYRQVIDNKAPFAQLLYLDGLAKEVLFRNNIVSYFQLDRESFSVNSSRITEVFPDIVFNDFNELSQYYDFFVLGKARILNRSSQLVRIIAKNKDRYSYVIWIDDNTYLPLRIDLFDLDNNILEQFRIVSLSPLSQVNEFKQYVEQAPVSTLLMGESIDDKENSTWNIDKLPSGFKQISHLKREYKNMGVSSKLFSDGVFSFFVSITNTNEKNLLTPQTIQQSNRTIYSTNLNGKNIVIIGDVPLNTIQDIAEHITFE